MPGYSDNVISVWECDEQSAASNLVDSFGSNTLTAVSSPGVSTGKIGGARNFNGSQYFYAADNASLSVGGLTSWSASMWVKFASISGYHCIIAKCNSGGGDVEFEFRYANANSRFQFIVTNDGSTGQFVEANSFGAASTGVWYFVVIEHNAVTHKLTIQVNNGAIDEAAAHSSGGYDSTNAMTVGSRTSLGIPFYGDIDQIIFRKRIVPAAERSLLYNNGNGMTFTNLLATGSDSLSGLYSAWPEMNS